MNLATRHYPAGKLIKFINSTVGLKKE